MTRALAAPLIDPALKLTVAVCLREGETTWVGVWHRNAMIWVQPNASAVKVANLIFTNCMRSAKDLNQRQLVKALQSAAGCRRTTVQLFATSSRDCREAKQRECVRRSETEYRCGEHTHTQAHAIIQVPLYNQCMWNAHSCKLTEGRRRIVSLRRGQILPSSHVSARDE